MSDLILSVKNLNAYYRTHGSLFNRKSARKQVLFDISFDLGRGEIAGLVGESGCGKSTLGKAILSMVKDTEGEIMHYSQMPQMIFQDPYGSLNPAKTVGWILKEPLRIKGIGTEKQREDKAAEILDRVGLDTGFMLRYPSELSGGQRQRVCIALALMTEPKLIIADEPVSALDVTIQAQIIRLLLKLNREFGIAMIFISHDLKVVYQICERVMVMYGGRIVEEGSDKKVYFSPEHEYTKKLLTAAGCCPGGGSSKGIV
jgi:peptide/nickel transport system ATP-binding protein